MTSQNNDKTMVSDGGSTRLEGIISDTGTQTGLTGETPRSDRYVNATGEEQRVSQAGWTLRLLMRKDRIGT